MRKAVPIVHCMASMIVAAVVMVVMILTINRGYVWRRWSKLLTLVSSVVVLRWKGYVRRATSSVQLSLFGTKLSRLLLVDGSFAFFLFNVWMALLLARAAPHFSQ